MLDKNNKPLNVALHGMDDRSSRTIRMFFRGPCNNAAVIVGDDHADADLVDLDSYNAREKFERQRAKFPERPVIVLSLKKPELDGVIYVKKPIKVPEMMEAIDRVRSRLMERVRRVAAPAKNAEKPRAATVNSAGKGSRVDLHERKKASKHGAAIQLDERGFNRYIGAFAAFDPNNIEQRKRIFYSPKGYLQSYLQSAAKISLSKNRILMLSTGWKPIIIFPHTREVWVDADEKQLRSFCSVPINTISDFNVDGGKGGQVTIKPLNLDQDGGEHDPAKFQSLDAFLWKVALFTSKGRLPEGVDLDAPVYLKRWPNFTRLLLIPHSLRIAALLMDEPRTLPDVADVLKIRHQYVFAFFSAAHAVGLTGQTVRRADTLVAPTAVEKTKRSGLFGKILSRLRGK